MLTCFVCGAPVPSSSTGAVPICAACAASGAQLDRSSIRFVAQDSEGGTHGPLPAEQVVERLAKGILSPDSPVARDGAAWRPLCEHPDFRSAFVPGTPLHDHYSQHADAGRRAQAQMDRRRVVRGAVGAGAVTVAALFGAWTWQSGGLILPESWVDRAGEGLGSAREAVESQVGLAMDEPEARSEVAQRRGLPGDELVAELAAAHAGSSRPVGLAVVEGRLAWWEGTPVALAKAQADLEEAVGRSPEDPEVVGALTEILALRQRLDPSVVDTMSQLVERADALAPDLLPSVRARAVVAWGSGNSEQAAEIAGACLKLSGGPAAGDPMCALVAGDAARDEAALAALSERIGPRAPVLLAQARAARSNGQVDALADHAERLVALRPGDARSHRLLMQARRQLGQLDAAAQAGAELLRLEPSDMESTHQLARMGLALRRSPASLRRTLEAAAETQPAALEVYEGRVAFYAEIAGLALLEGDAEGARAWAKEAAELDAGSPGAALVLAQLHVAQGDQEAAAAVLKDVEIDELDSRAQARYHLQAGRIFRALGLGRAAMSALDEAVEAEPLWPEARLERLSLLLELKNMEGVVDGLEQLALIDLSFEGERDPVVALFVPPADWATLRRAVEDAVLDDGRLTARQAELNGLMSFATGHDSASRYLERAVEEHEGRVAVHAAMAQLARRDGDWAALAAHVQPVLGSRPDDPQWQALAGLAAAGQGRAQEARRLLEKANRGDTVPAHVRLVVADGWARLSEHAEARAVLEQLLEEDPSLTGARLRLLDLPEGEQ